MSRGQHRLLHLPGPILACAPLVSTFAPQRQYRPHVGEGKGYGRPGTRKLPIRKASLSQAYLDPRSHLKVALGLFLSGSFTRNTAKVFLGLHTLLNLTSV